MTTKEIVANGFGVAALFWCVVVMVCYTRFVVELFRRKEYAGGVLFGLLLVFVGGGWTLGTLAGLPVGWAKARRWGFRRWVVVWTVALAAGVACLTAGLIVAKTSLGDRLV